MINEGAPLAQSDLHKASVCIVRAVVLCRKTLLLEHGTQDILNCSEVVVVVVIVITIAVADGVNLC